jgi:hypothetical protein
MIATVAKLITGSGRRSRNPIPHVPDPPEPILRKRMAQGDIR